MRPSTYTPEVIEAAKEYLEAYQELDPPQLVPTVVGLCKHIGRAKSTVYDWQKDPEKTEFSDILEQIEERQHIDLVNGGLGGSYNSVITKMMLTKHGYSDKQEIDHTSTDGSMTPPAPTYKITDE